MKILILTDFSSCDLAYSLCGVVDEQLKMLEGVSDRYAFALAVDGAYPPAGTPWHRFEILRIPGGIPRSNSIVKDETWDADIETLRAGIEKVVVGFDVVITHDLIYQPSMIKHHLASKQVAANHPEILWLHEIHSATESFAKQHAQWAGQPFFPNSRIVFPNAYDARRVAGNYGISVDMVRHVPHSTDPFKFLASHRLFTELAKEIDLLDADYIATYPTRLDRGKQVEMGIEIMARIKRMGHEIRYLVFDFHSTGGDKVEYRKHLEMLCKGLHLQLGREVVFMSQWREETHTRSPQEMVASAMRFGDLLILPSKSESYSKIVQEAALCRNALMLNQNFPPIRSVYGDDALYGQFSANINALSGEHGETNTQYGSRTAYMDDMARWLLAQLDHPVLRQFRFRRKYRNPHAVFRDYLEPLFGLLGGR